MSDMVLHQSNFIAPAVDIDTALRRYQAVHDFIKAVLKEKVDFGTVPGNDKQVLLKPGAEKMASLFALTPKFPLEDFTEDWTGANHGGEPFFNYRYKCQLYRGDQFISESEGSANSWEKKYRYRKMERECPQCHQTAIIKGKEEYGGGWLCWKKNGGCGATFPNDDSRITSQVVGVMKNPDPADLPNTMQKMAQKRALVAAVLIATNTSEYFTQDIEDYIEGTFTDKKNEEPSEGERKQPDKKKPSKKNEEPPEGEPTHAPVTAFWSLVKETGMPKSEADALLKQCGGDFVDALKMLKARQANDTWDRANYLVEQELAPTYDIATMMIKRADKKYLETPETLRQWAQNYNGYIALGGSDEQAAKGANSGVGPK